MRITSKISEEESTPFRVFNSTHIDTIPQLQHLSKDVKIAMKSVATVLPFQINNYVIDQLIDWDKIPNDPIYNLTFPQPGMLAEEDFEAMRALWVKDAPSAQKKALASEIRMKLNPNPGEQKTLNVPQLRGTSVEGIQHKYRETVLFFPSQGQTCHAYCAYCFRWSQFVGMQDLKFATRDTDRLIQYLHSKPEVTDILFTGGDPMIMKTVVLEKYMLPLLDLKQLKSIRIGTKALAWWPYRFTTDRDSDDLMRLFETIVQRGKHLAIMAHASHPNEFKTQACLDAITRIRNTGAIIRSQAPVIRHVNDDASVWSSMWQHQVELGIIPYYMFVERDTGAKDYFKIPLIRTLDIFQKAYAKISGLARTVRGPSMSCTPGKVMVDGVSQIGGERVFVLKFLQARDSEWSNRVFFAKFDENACWINDLKPALGDKKFFFE